MRNLEAIAMVRRSLRPGDRQVFLAAEPDFWGIARPVPERRGEPGFDECLRRVGGSARATAAAPAGPGRQHAVARLAALQDFYGAWDTMAAAALRLGPPRRPAAADGRPAPARRSGRAPRRGRQAMIVVVAGGTGFIGRALVAALHARGDEVAVLTRSPAAPPPPGAQAVAWDARPGGARPAWWSAVARADAVVNLAGESIAGRRWSPAQKDRIMSSRVDATRAVVAAMGADATRPRTLINASAVGFYGPRADEPVSEADGPGHDFLARVCVAGETEASRAEAAGARVVLPRFGLVLARDGGALPRIALPFRLFAGGPLGGGRQWVPWIHLDDAVGLLLLLLGAEAARGPVNAVGPAPLRSRDFARALGRALGRPSWLPAPAPLLRLALGEAADALLLAGQRALPRRAEALGYRFRHATAAAALGAIYG